ncbi:hypothetical protein HED55_10235 [Ochrobactrum haematophilum]|uniref:Uncharacterized protein n=1 Tax=Brucella haematophila TaxID=419474 RepID=A0ABX1DQJ8_9HYPH|nr:hypothetical protein [Brucella haematophila]
MIKPAINYIKVVDAPSSITVNDATGAVYVSNGKEIERINYVAPGNFSYGGKASKIDNPVDIKVSSYNNYLYVPWSTSNKISVIDENLIFFSQVDRIPSSINKYTGRTNYYYSKYDRKILFQAYFVNGTGLVIIDSITGDYEKFIDLSSFGMNGELTALCCTPSGLVFCCDSVTKVIYCINIDTEEHYKAVDFRESDFSARDIAVDSKRKNLIVIYRNDIDVSQYINFTIWITHITSKNR